MKLIFTLVHRSVCTLHPVASAIEICVSLLLKNLSCCNLTTGCIIRMINIYDIPIRLSHSNDLNIITVSRKQAHVTSLRKEIFTHKLER